MSKCCGSFVLQRIVLVLLEISVFLHEENFVTGMLLSKSDLTVCDNVGRNPHNVVDNKSCQKKLVIAQSVRSGQVRMSLYDRQPGHFGH